MPNTKRAARSAVLPLAAAFAVAPGATAAPAAPTPAPTPAPTVLAGGAQLQAPAAVASVPRSGRIVRVLSRRLTLVSGSTISVGARTTTVPVHVELRVGRHGRVIDSADAAAGTSFTLRGTAASGERLWLRARRTDGGTERAWAAVGQVRAMRPALASWYGPGLYGQRTACGQTLTAGLKGVAHKTLPCGTRLTIRYGGRSTTAVVVDRGPYAGGREFDLTSATAQAIGFGAVGRVWVARR